MHIPKKIGAVPVPQTDECLSSFLIRLASRQGLSPHTLCHILWPDYQFWTRDIDRCARVGLIHTMSQRTGLDETSIEQLTLRPLMQSITGQVRRCGVSRWILPIGVYHRVRRAYGQRYCPDCLAETPRHLQRVWRLGYQYICHKHYRCLEDACFECDAPFIPHRHNSLLQAICHECGADLTKAPGKRVSDTADALQQHLECVRTQSDAAADQFSGWHTLLSILARNDERFKSQAGSWFMWRQFERAQLLSAGFELFQNWPASFVRWADDHRLSQAGLNDYRCQSTWLSTAIALLPERYMPPRKPRRRSPARPQLLPKSRKHTVNGKSAMASAMLNAAYRVLRLQRKLRVRPQ